MRPDIRLQVCNNQNNIIMMAVKHYGPLIASFLTAHTLACQIGNQYPSAQSSAPNDSGLCQPQGAGQWTFSMQVNETSLGIPSVVCIIPSCCHYQ